MSAAETSAVALLSAVSRRAIARVENAVERVLSRIPFAPRARFLVAVSGGADSVALLHALQRLQRRAGPYRVLAAHFNHRIRGCEADRDEAFVRQLCGCLGVELMVERAHGLTSRRSNLEERAREARYAFLNRAADNTGARYIVLGHHGDDQAETVLLRLLRGSGAAGLSAMADRGPGRLLRPMLQLRRASLLAYLAALDARFVTDSSNSDTAVLRNRVRLALLPQLEREYAPGIAGRLIELAVEMRQADSFIAAEAERTMAARLLAPVAKGEVGRMDLRGLGSVHPAVAAALMRALIARCVGDLRRVRRFHIREMCRLAVENHPSAAVALPGGWNFRREYDAAVLERRDGALPASFSVPLHAGDNSIAGVPFSLTVRLIAQGEDGFPSSPWHTQSRNEAYLDADAAGRLSARSFRVGDRIRPLGMDGSRKVQDVFVDRKVALAKRRLWPLVVLQNEVLWIPGLVRSRLALLTAKSRKVLYLQAKTTCARRGSSIA